MLAAYLAFSASAEPLAKAVLRKRLKRGKEDKDRCGERLGMPSLRRPDGILVWFHSASVGEALSILKLVDTLGRMRSDLVFLVTTGTVSSAKILATRKSERTYHQFVPYDVRNAVGRFLDYWRPAAAVWTENELWPALICETHERRVPMLYVNAHMSSASFRKWRFLRGVSSSLLSRFARVLVQDSETAGYLQDLGLPGSRMEVTGSLKGNADALPCDEHELARFKKLLGDRPVWLAASTHEGEDSIAAAAHAAASKRVPGLFLIVAPRHPERGPDIAKSLADEGFRLKVRSSGEIPESGDDMYVADTLGEMGLWYRMAFASFVGGSMVDVGGHNPFEPAALGSAVIHGPNVRNFSEIYDRLSSAGAAVQVESSEELADAVSRLGDPDAASKLTQAASVACSQLEDITALAARVVLSHLPEERRSACGNLDSGTSPQA